MLLPPVIRQWHDISVILDADLPIWPGSPGVVATSRMSISRADAANVTQLNIDVHSGTHVDAPRHFIDHGATVEELGLDPFVGAAVVVDAGLADEIGASVLAAAKIPDDAERILLRTRNSSRPELYKTPFDENYAALTLSGAEWLVDRGVRLVGIDYLSIQRFRESPDVHRVLLDAGTSILEGVCLVDVAPGPYELICLPIRLANVEGAPARAILLPPPVSVQ
jgi:arylformamidase